VKDRADLPSLETRDQPAGLFCRDSDKVNASARSLRHHLGHVTICLRNSSLSTRPLRITQQHNVIRAP
jgi:hypothetical protein